MKENKTSNKEKFFLWTIWCAFTLLISYFASKHEPWFDEYHVWVMCKQLKLTWLWSAMMHEGHFILWHLLIYPFVKIGFSYWSLQLVSVTLTSAAAWILIMKSPFGYLTKCLIVFSYPLLYLFPVISRCYALIPLLLFYIAWLYPKQEEHPYQYCLCVGLLAHTHAYMEGLVGSLFLLFCYEHIYLPHKNKKCVSRFIKAASVTIFVVFIAFLQVYGSLQFANENLQNRNNSITEVIESFFLFTTSNALFIIPGNWHKLFPDIVLSNSLYIILSVLLWFFILINAIIVFWRERINRKYIVVYVGAIGWQIWMALFVYGYGHQRIFTPMIILILLLWLAFKQEIKYHIFAIVSSLFILTAGHWNIIRDIKGLFCEDTTLQCYVENNIKPKADLFFTAYFIQGVEKDLYIDYNIHFTTNNLNASSPQHIDGKYISRLFKDSINKDAIYVFTDKKYNVFIDQYHLEQLTNIGTYYIYKIDRATNSIENEPPNI